MIEYAKPEHSAGVVQTLRYVLHRIIMQHLGAYCLVIALACLLGLAIIH